MSTELDLEQRLRDELGRRAAATRMSASALADIKARTASASRPPAWRRPTLALVAAAVVLVAAVFTVSRGGEDTGTEKPDLPAVQPLPNELPALSGTVVGIDAEGWSFQIDVQAPGTALPQSDQVLRDGRVLTDNDGTTAWQVVDRTTGEAISLDPGEYPRPLDVLPDGRVATVRLSEPGRKPGELVIFERSGEETVVSFRLERFDPIAITAGPEGWLAVLGGKVLALVSPDLDLTYVDLAGAFEAGHRSYTIGSPSASWGDNGLVAIRVEAVAQPGEVPPDPDGWTVVVNPSTGERIAMIDGWKGTAWTPDGTGLLVGRATGQGGGELRLYWGEGLAQYSDVGSTDTYLTPAWWVEGS